MKLLDERDEELQWRERELQEAQQQRLLLADQLKTLNYQLASTKQGMPSRHNSSESLNTKASVKPSCSDELGDSCILVDLLKSSRHSSQNILFVNVKGCKHGTITEFRDSYKAPTAILMPLLCCSASQETVAETRDIQASNHSSIAAFDAKEAKLQSNAEKQVQHARKQHDRDRAILLVQRT